MTILTEDFIFANLEAIHEGTATQIIHCDICADDFWPTISPLRGVRSTFITRGSDPTEAYRLTCGHTVI